jgi:phosphate transport system substrate-binding protein
MAATSPQQASRIAWMLALILAAFLPGCGGTTPPAVETVVVDGSSTVYQISREAMQSFKKVDENINVIVNKSGTGGGFGKYLQNEVDVVDASRPAKAEEEAKAKEQGLAWDRFLVGYDGITVVVNPKNDFVKDLTVEQLKKLWGPDSTVKTWKDLDPSWPNRPISFYSPDKDSGTFEFFTEATVGKARSQRPDVQASSDDNTLVKGVAGDDDGIGYFGYAYYKANSEILRAIPIKKTNEAPAVEANPETILAKTYAPLSRPLYIYVKKSAMRKPGAAAFVKYYLENVKTLATKARYVSPTDEDDAANKKTLTPSG